jgi:hypothetical protein
MKQSSGDMRRERAKVRPQTKMQIERAGPTPRAPSLRAQRGNPETFRSGRLDCFAALAMTEQKQLRTKLGLVPRTLRSNALR